MFVVDATPASENGSADTSRPDIAHESVSFAVVDVETTGLDPETDRILQVAAVVVDATGTVIESFDTIVKPENPDTFDNGAEHVNRITAEQVMSGMPLREALEKLWQISRGRRFTAHNAAFDIGFLHAESRRVGIDETVDTWIDTLALARLTDAERSRRHSLTALCEHYGITREREHEALSDATATAKLLFHLSRDIGVGSPAELPDYSER